MISATAFGVVVSAANWASALLRVAQFLVFSEAAAWRRLTFLVLAVLLAAVGITSGLKL